MDKAGIAFLVLIDGPGGEFERAVGGTALLIGDRGLVSIKCIGLERFDIDDRLIGTRRHRRLGWRDG